MAVSRKMFWTGWVISVLPCLLFVVSAVAKIVRPPEVVKGFAQVGVPEPLILTIAILELSCVVIYLIPRTAILGAILFTGFIGGAILTHLRVGEAVYTHIVLGILLWLGIYLREERLWPLLPIRRP